MKTGNQLVDHVAGVYIDARRMGYSHQIATRMADEEFRRANPSEYEVAKAMEALAKAMT